MLDMNLTLDFDSPDSAALTHITDLQDLSLADRQAIAALLKLQRFNKGDVVVRAHEDTSDLYFVMSGSLRVSLVASTGRLITYQIIRAGDMFGELAAIDGQSRSADVTAEEDTLVGRLAGHHLPQLCLDIPAFAWTLMQRLAAQSRRLTQKVFEYHTYDVRGRVCLELLTLAQKSPTFSITDRDMASRVGTTRENVSRIHSELRNLGLIRRNKSSVSQVDQAGLTTLLKDSEFH